MKQIFTFFIIAFFSTTLPLRAEPSDQPGASLVEALTASKKKIEGLNQNVKCRKNQDCVALGLGEKACGGPSSYVIASKRNLSFQKLVEEIKVYTDLEKRRNQEEGLFSNCSYESPPETLCLDHLCREKEAGRPPRPFK